MLISQNKRCSVGFHFEEPGKAEVDLVIDTERTVTPVEAKYKHLRKTGIPASLRSFISKYQPENAYIINLSLRDTARIDNAMVHFLPFH